MSRSHVVLLMLACACSQKKTAPVDAGSDASPPLLPGFLGTTEPDAPRAGAKPIAVVLDGLRGACALLDGGEVWCWSLGDDAPDPGRVPGTWDRRVDEIAARDDRVLLRSGGEYALFHDVDTQHSAARHRRWFRNAPVSLGSDAPLAWRCPNAGPRCLVGGAHAMRLLDAAAGSVHALAASALCRGATLDVAFPPDAADRPWLGRCGEHAYFFAVSADALIARALQGVPKGARVVGWHHDTSVEVQGKDGKVTSYLANVSSVYTHADWTGGAPLAITPSADPAPPAASALAKQPCETVDSELICSKDAPPALVARAQKLVTSF